MNTDQGRYCSDEIKTGIGQLVKRERECIKITPYRLAELCGCAPATIKNIESGRYAPGYNLLYKLAAAFSIEAKELLP